MKRARRTRRRSAFCAAAVPRHQRGTTHSLDLYFLPGIGEIFRIPFFSRSGRVDVLAFEAVPAARWSPSATRRRRRSAAFYRAVLELVGRYAPALRERVNTREFALIGPGEVAQGGIRPVVRRGWVRWTTAGARWRSGTPWIVNDPLTAQGANLGSHTAFALAELDHAGAWTVRRGILSIHHGATLGARAHVVEWSNAFLAPPRSTLPRCSGRRRRQAGRRRLRQQVQRPGRDVGDPVDGQKASRPSSPTVYRRLRRPRCDHRVTASERNTMSSSATGDGDRGILITEAEQAAVWLLGGLAQVRVPGAVTRAPVCMYDGKRSVLHRSRDPDLRQATEQPDRGLLAS